MSGARFGTGLRTGLRIRFGAGFSRKRRTVRSVCDEVDTGVFVRLRDKARNQVGGRVWDRVEDQVWGRVEDQVWVRVGDWAWDAAKDRE